MNHQQHLIIEGSAKTPKVDFHALTGDLILSGRSLPENAAKVFEPLLFWINEYIKDPSNNTNFRLNLDYYNTASFLWISRLIKAIGKIDKPGCILYIHIYFDIEDYDEMDSKDIRDVVGSYLDSIEDSKISVEVRTYGTDSDGKIVKESKDFIVRR